MRRIVLLALLGLAACAPESDELPQRELDLASPPGAEPAPGEAWLEPPRDGPGCIRGGSTREEVRAVMGEPDSVSFGAWIYGRSSVSFGYGTVIELENGGGELIVC